MGASRVAFAAGVKHLANSRAEKMDEIDRLHDTIDRRKRS